MVELITKIASLIILIVQWIFGKQALRAQRAKELATKFKQINVEGDNLFEQVWSELNRQSNSDWEDIPVRNNNQNEGDSNG
jgi:hypothetical protein